MNVNEHILAMQIWDTAGQEKYNSLQGLFYKGADACIIVFDLTNISTFQTIIKWKDDFENHAGIRDPAKFPFIIIGNKADMTSQIQVTDEKAQKFADEQNIKYLAVSAKTGENVELAFQEISQKFLGYHTNPKNAKMYIFAVIK